MTLTPEERASLIIGKIGNITAAPRGIPDDVAAALVADLLDAIHAAITEERARGECCKLAVAEERARVVWIADVLDEAMRQGAAEDQPGGARYVQFSDTLARQLADAIRGVE